MEQFLGLIVLGAIVWFIYAWNTRKKSGGTNSSGTSKARSNSAKQPEGLAFDTAGTDPETDDKGRVIARLGAGSQIEFDVFLLGGGEQDRFLLGKPKDDTVERTVRVRVSKALKRDQVLYEVATPKGEVFGEIAYRDTEQAAKVFGILQQNLQGMHPALAGKEFVFDVALRVEGEWYEDEEEEGGWAGDVDSLFIRIKDPASIDIQ